MSAPLSSTLAKYYVWLLLRRPAQKGRIRDANEIPHDYDSIMRIWLQAP